MPVCATSRSTLAQVASRSMGGFGFMHATSEVRRPLSDPADALQRIEEVMRLSRSAVWEVDRDGVFTYVSRSFEDLLGYRPEDLVGIHTIHDFYPADFPEVLRRELSDDWIGAGEEYTGVELPLAARSGEIIWVTSHGKPVYDGDGKVAGFRGVDVDISARKHSEERLRASEEELQRVLDNLQFPVATSVAGADFGWQDPRARVTYLNKRFTELLGYTLEDIPTVGEWARRSYPAEEQRIMVLTELDRQVQAALAGAVEIGPVETRLTAKDGRERDVVIKALAVGNRVVISLEDMTERNRVLRNLHESSARVQAVVANTPVPIAYTLAGGGEIHLNKAFTETYGWTEREVPTVDAWFEKAYPDPDYRREVLACWSADVERAQRSDGSIAPRSYRVAAKDGSVREVEISAVVFEGEMFGSFLDLTERNRAERLMREQQEQLARVGRVSTLGQLAASLAHELEQPLAAILRNAETADLLLRSGKRLDRAELGAIVTDILADDRRAGAVLDRIRAMVRMRRFEPQALAVEPLLRAAADLIRPAAMPRGIAVEISCQPGLGQIEGDPVLLQQVLLNLLLNAVEAIGKRADGRIAIQAAEARQGTVEISVTDNGGGVSASDVDFLFEPFRTTKTDGLGMGLPLVRSIMEEHGGSVRLANEPGRGMTVHLQLPALRGAAG